MKVLSSLLEESSHPIVIRMAVQKRIPYFFIKRSLWKEVKDYTYIIHMYKMRYMKGERIMFIVNMKYVVSNVLR